MCQEKGSSPLGWLVIGSGGVGKTHLIGAIPGDGVVVPQFAQQRAEHDARTDLLLIHGLEEIMNVANDQIPFIEDSNELELAKVAVHNASHSFSKELRRLLRGCGISPEAGRLGRSTFQTFCETSASR